MGFWAKSLLIFNSFCDNAKQSIRQVAHQTGLSKSSVHRLKQAIDRRARHPESWFWETEEGRRWLIRLVVAVLYIFGLKRGVGAETISEFFAHLRLETHVGCSPSALRGVMQALEQVILETAAAWEHKGIADGEVRPIIGAVDETFLERLMLVFMDLVSGYLLVEEVADDRTYDTWYALVETRLEALGAGVLYLVSDRAKALMKLAETGLECLSIPDLFHLIHELVKSYSLAIVGRLRQARQALSQAQERLAKCQASNPSSAEAQQAQAVVEACEAEARRWESVHSAYRHHLETVSLIVHPWRVADSTRQTSEDVERQLQAETRAIEGLVETNALPVKKKALDKVRKQLADVAALVDFWWQGAFETHPITQQLAPKVLEGWKVWAAEHAKAFQRASSAVEGRNGYLSQMQHNHRGLPKRRYKVWTVLHNFDCHASDGTTPASRFFRREFPDLFEMVLSQLDDLPRPRKRNQATALTD